jgi:hypothetical protein
MPNDISIPARIFHMSIPKNRRMKVRRARMRRKRRNVRFISMNPAMSFFHGGMGFQRGASFRVIGAKVIKPAKMRGPVETPYQCIRD